MRFPMAGAVVCLFCLPLQVLVIGDTCDHEAVPSETVKVLSQNLVNRVQEALSVTLRRWSKEDERLPRLNCHLHLD
jgi:hypothetical protein